MQVTEEDLKKMTPEQITELQKQNCVFCHIVSGKVPSRKVYEDEKVIAILDIHPANPGHIVLLPKEHYYIMPLVPEDYINHIFMIAKALSQAMLKALQIKGTNIFVQNGPVAGQKAPHFIVHIIPRTEKDGVELNLLKNRIAQDQLNKLQEAIKKGVDKIFGLKKGEIDAEYEEIKKEKDKEQTTGAKIESTKSVGKPDNEDEPDFDEVIDLLKGSEEPKDDEKIDLDKVGELFK